MKYGAVNSDARTAFRTVPLFYGKGYGTMQVQHEFCTVPYWHSTVRHHSLAKSALVRIVVRFRYGSYGIFYQKYENLLKNDGTLFYFTPLITPNMDGVVV